MKEWTNKFQGKFDCSSKKTNQKLVKNDNEDNVIVSYKIICIDSAKFMTSPLSNLVDNLTERSNKSKCKDFNCFHKYKSVNDNLIKYKCLSCNKNYSSKLDEKSEKRFRNTFSFSNNDINNLFCC